MLLVLHVFYGCLVLGCVSWVFAGIVLVCPWFLMRFPGSLLGYLLVFCLVLLGVFWEVFLVFLVFLPWRYCSFLDCLVVIGISWCVFPLFSCCFWFSCVCSFFRVGSGVFKACFWVFLVVHAWCLLVFPNVCWCIAVFHWLCLVFLGCSRLLGVFLVLFVCV